MKEPERGVGWSPLKGLYHETDILNEEAGEGGGMESN
jgi:hypothetical protein